MPRTLPTTIGMISQCLPFHIETGSTLCSYSHTQLPCSGPLTNTENARVCSAQDYQLQFPSKFPVPALATDLMKDFFSLIKLFLTASGLTDTPSKASAHTENHTSEALGPRPSHNGHTTNAVGCKRNARSQAHNPQSPTSRSSHLVLQMSIPSCFFIIHNPWR